MSYKSNEPCICCGHELDGEVCYHHLFTRKAYPNHAEKKWNMIPVCLSHHSEFHNKGITYMAVKYKTVMEWLKNNQWFFCKTFNKWRNNND